MDLARLRLAAAATVASALVVGGLVVTPAAHAAITGSRITTPSNPSFFVADEDASTQTFAISGTTSGGNPASDAVDVNCYWDGSVVTVAKNVALKSNGSFSIPNANLNEPLDLTCRLRAVPAGTNLSVLSAFSGPVIGVSERDSDRVAVGPNTGRVTGYQFDAQQKTAAFDYVSLGNCGLNDGYLYDSTFAQTTTTFYCNAGLLLQDSPLTPTRSELQIDGADAYDPFSADLINPNATGLPSLTNTYTVDKKTGNVVIHEKEPLVKCTEATYPPNEVSCATFVSTGVTDNRTITQNHDGHVSWITDSFASTDHRAHALDLLWDNSQHFWGDSGDSSQLEYEFPGQSSFSKHIVGDNVTLPSSTGTIRIRMQGAADGDMDTGQGAIVYDRPAAEAKFTFVQSFVSDFTLRQTGNVPAGGSTQFRFAYVQDYHAAKVASLAKAARTAFLNRIAVSKLGRGKGRVTSSPGGIACGRACTHGYASGTSVTLKAKAAEGSKFSGWSGACKGTRSCRITTNHSASVKAKFVLRPCVVPNLQGRTLKAAKVALKQAFCSVGTVKTAPSSQVKKGQIIAQQPKHGKRLKQHAKVSLIVGTG
jgi:Divergent InlB B-repeat domain/PASTA domain